MPVWVVPSIAADLWQMSVADVTRLIDQQKLTVKSEHGFLFVDIESRHAASPPMTYVPFQRDLPILDTDATLDADPFDAEFADAPGTLEPVFAQDLDSPDDSQMLIALQDPAEWISVRRETARKRVSPRRRRAA